MSPSTKPSPRPDGAISRRTLLRGAAGGAAVLAARGLPAWARPVADAWAAAGLRRPDSLPCPRRPAGTPSMPQIDHVVVLVMENHSFDNLLGMVPYQVPAPTAAGADGLTRRRGRITNANRDMDGRLVFAEHAVSPCQLPRVPSQAWNASHQSWNGGRNDGFVEASGPMAMRFWDKRDLPFTYSLVEHFPIGDRFFCFDANADPMTDYFDFRRPAFAKPPRLAAAPALGPGLAQCHAAGLNPPLPPGTAGASDVTRYLRAVAR